MRRLVCAGALLLCAALCGACKPPTAIFEDVGTDPHPPQLEVEGVAYQPVADSAGVIPAPDLKPLDGFVVRPYDTAENTLLFRVKYFDLGGDVQFFEVRDRDGSLDQQVTPTAPEVDVNGVTTTLTTPDFFTGTAGTVDLKSVSFIGTTMGGAHRIEIWIEDGHGSRSAKVTFTVEVIL